MSEPFDPYRYGRPDHPVPPEYAPPGYVPDPTPAAPSATSAPYHPGGTPTPNAYQQPPTPYAGPGHPGAPHPGAPVPPPYNGYQQPRTGNGKAIAALVLGIASIVFCWVSVFDAVFVVLAVVFGLIVLSEARRGGRGRGMAIAGVACAVVGALLATVLTVKIIDAADQCGGLSHPGVSTEDFRQCLSDNF
jgi:Domain of unknown function (DUF4190)